MSSSRVRESRVLPKNIDAVWKLLRTGTLNVGRQAQFTFWHAVKSVEVEGTPDAVGSVRTITYKDGTVEHHRILELSDLNTSLSYEIFASNPPAKVMGAVHTITLRPVTHDGTTLVELSAEYAAGDWTAQVVEDAKYKKKEMLEDLYKAVA
ncbi:hypothetical protein DFJ73DRAFT_233443 [Zopfochytrium polystomum]|nr:hypothetical protein DFJ73DRAFT_233443 [Zopfochytrium polystomum]